MPKKIIKYQCMCCGMEYTSENRALESEKSHNHAVRICKELYSRLSRLPDIPEWLDVLMDDGSTRRYRLIGER